MKKNFQILCSIVAMTVLLIPSVTSAKSGVEIDINVNKAIDIFKEEVNSAEMFLNRSAGILIFPRVIKVGIGIGAETGEGALRVKGQTVDYYRTTSGSIGLQLGVQVKSVIIAFMTNESLEKFRNSEGWNIGVDGSVTMIDYSASTTIDSHNIKDSVVGFIFGSKGLMFNLTLEGSKISKLDKTKK